MGTTGLIFHSTTQHSCFLNIIRFFDSIRKQQVFIANFKLFYHHTKPEKVKNFHLNY